MFTTTPGSLMLTAPLSITRCSSAVDFRTRADFSSFHVTRVIARNGRYAASPGGCAKISARPPSGPVGPSPVLPLVKT